MAKPDGLDRLLRQLKRLPPSIKTAAADTVMENAQILAGKIAAAAPRSKKKTWPKHLADTVRVVQGDNGGPAETGGQLKTELGLSVSIMAGSDEAPHARWVEFGTAPGVRGERAGVRASDVKQHSSEGRIVRRTHPGTPAQPFFFPTVRAQRKPLKSRLARVLNKAVKTEAAKP